MSNGVGSESAPSKLPVDVMTSREFHLDERAHLESISQRLKDRHTMRVFHDVIMHNQHLFRGRVVMDVGCGVGMLSLFAAKAGAARVYAVDWSNVTDYTRRVVRQNGLGHVVHVLKGRVSEVELPADAAPHVDIIVSNWMGQSLLSQAICDEVIDARDKWLRPGGLIFPDVAKLYVVGVEDQRHRAELFNWWNDVYGFNMNFIGRHMLYEPCRQRVTPDQVITSFYRIKKLDLHTAKKEDLRVRTQFRLVVHRHGYLDGLMTFFHAIFTDAHKLTSFSTDPDEPCTRLAQTVFYFQQSLYVTVQEEWFGGIEMATPAANGRRPSVCDLNNLLVTLELYRGVEYDVLWVLDMTWSLRTSWLLNSYDDGSFQHLCKDCTVDMDADADSATPLQSNGEAKCERRNSIGNGVDVNATPLACNAAEQYASALTGAPPPKSFTRAMMPPSTTRSVLPSASRPKAAAWSPMPDDPHGHFRNGQRLTHTSANSAEIRNRSSTIIIGDQRYPIERQRKGRRNAPRLKRN